MQVMFLAGWIATIALSTSSSYAVQLFVIAGQSNASGAAKVAFLTPAQQAPQTDVLFWYDFDNTSSGDRFKDLKPVKSTFGPELEAGRVLASNLTEEVAIVKVSFGGTTLTPLSEKNDWSPNSPGEHFDTMIENVVAARDALITEGKQVTLAGLFWMQGESDAKSGGGGVTPPPQPESANAYGANLTEFILEMRNDLNTPQMPVFLGEIKIGDGTNFDTPFGMFDFTPTIQAGQAAVATSDVNVHLVDTSSFGLRADNLHFNFTGQTDLGAAFANSYLQTVPEPSTAVLGLISLLFVGRVRWRRSMCQEK